VRARFVAGSDSDPLHLMDTLTRAHHRLTNMLRTGGRYFRSED